MPMTPIDRLPPHSQESEASLLGCLVDYAAAAEVIDEVLQRVPVEAFYDLRHQEIYKALTALHLDRKPLTVVSLHEQLKAAGKLDACGGDAYLASLPDTTPSPHNADYFIGIVLEHYTRRRLVQTGAALVQMAYEETTLTQSELIDRTEAAITGICPQDEKRELKTIKELVHGAINTVEIWHQNQGIPTGITSGYPDLDKLTMGFVPGVYIIAGRPSMGKTSLALNILEHITVVQATPAGFISLEMSSEQLALRLLFAKSRVNMRDASEGFLGERDFPRLSAAAGMLVNAPLYIDDTSGMTVLQIRSRLRQWVRLYGIKFAAIDYLGLIQAVRRRESRQLEVADISVGVKGIAKELGIPIMLLCQLNRDIEKEKNRKPRLSDLRESGAIEQDADLVGLLYRKANGDDDDPDAPVMPVELLIAKQRNGPTGTVHLTFLKNITRFESAARVDDEDGPHRQDHGIP